MKTTAIRPAGKSALLLVLFGLLLLPGCRGEDNSATGEISAAGDDTSCAEGCDEPAPALGSSRIATFNIKWLNDELETGTVSRGAEDYRAIAQVIVELGAAIIGIQEIEDISAVENLILEANLSDAGYEVITNGHGALEIGLLWDSSVAAIIPLEVPEGLTGFTRTPLVAQFSAGEFDGTLAVVHLKEGDDAESEDRRATEFAALQQWAEDYLGDELNDPDLLIFGDFNFDPAGAVPGNAAGLNLLAPADPTLTSGNGVVDFFLTSPDTIEEITSGIAFTANVAPIADYYDDNTISDHWPVFIEFNGSAGTADR